jgi:hypothetical protein
LWRHAQRNESQESSILMPTPRLPPASQIGKLDLSLVRNIDEDAGSGLLELKGLRMSICGLRKLVTGGIENRQRPSPC